MEIEKTAQTTGAQRSESFAVKQGSLVRVRVLRHIRSSSYLVEIRGKTHVARLEGRFPKLMFIARVDRLEPKMVLKYIRSFDPAGSPRQALVNGDLLALKKSFIQNLIATDNSFEKLLVPLQVNKKEIKESLHKAVRNQNIFRLLGRNVIGSKEIITYFCLQNNYNIIHYSSSALLFPLKIGEKYYPCDLKIFRGEDGLQNSVLLTVSLENERKIAFLVFIDYELINCTISSNSREIEARMRSNVKTLLQNLKSLKFDREVNVRFVGYDEEGLSKLGNMKKIDIRL